MNRIQTWKLEGRLQPSYILDHLGEGYFGFDRLGSRSFQSREGELSEDEFTSLLLAVGGLPPSCLGLGRFTYQIIAYLSLTPFYPSANEKPRATLTIAEIYRGLEWLTPNNVRGGDSRGRARTPADERRLLFQSLATATHDGARDADTDRQRATRNAFSMPEPDFEEMEWLHSNYCDDGDEMFHDVLDVLHMFQYDEDKFLPFANVKREDFRETAKELVAKQDRFRLHTLAIPLDEFTALVGFLLATQFEWEEGEKPELAPFNKAATAVARSFCDESSNVITWGKFDDMLPQMPFLFDPLYRILAAVFLERLPFEISYSFKAPTPPRDSFMTLPRLSQLASMVNMDLDFESFDRAHEWHKGIRPNARVLANVLRSMPEQSVLVVKGSSRSGGEFIFGFFNPLPAELETRKHEEDADLGPPIELDDEVGRQLTLTKLDAVHDRLEYRGSIMYPARPHVFMLSPAQRMVRLEGEPRVVGDRLFFGDALQLRDDGLVSFQAGDRNIHVKATHIEIWGETASRE
ncbi:unnamed protein product [Clonostachys chloroleuca]|uniref:Uncharacterized protein n=1 Tax=Clonostachys chloroleuca TaxID=1926264 RepID=A0AA35PXY7_9HYPO|nr:unnamed protein product [Clonostachys chloroleuca]